MLVVCTCNWEQPTIEASNISQERLICVWVKSGAPDERGLCRPWSCKLVLKKHIDCYSYIQL